MLSSYAEVFLDLFFGGVDDESVVVAVCFLAEVDGEFLCGPVEFLLPEVAIDGEPVAFGFWCFV